MKQQYFRAKTINQQLEKIADILTVEPLEKLENIASRKKIEDKSKYLKNVEYVHRVLERELKIIGDRILDQAKTLDRGQRDLLEIILQAINNNEDEILAEIGLNFRYVQFQDIITTITQSKFLFEVQAITAIPSPYGSFGAEANDIIGTELALLFRKMSPTPNNIRPTIAINEFFTSGSKNQQSKYERDQFVLNVMYFLESKGVIQPDDMPGRDVFIVRESMQVAKVDVLITQLRKSTKGKIQMDENGNIYFKPNAEFIESAGLSSPLRRKELAMFGILLKDTSGIPTSHALDAASYLNPINKYFVHLCIVNNKMEAAHDKVYLLLRAVDMIRKELFHDIFFDSESLPPDVIIYSIAKKFQFFAQKILQASIYYNEWSDFDPYEYTERNYLNNGEILPDDKLIIRHAIKTLKQLGIKPGSLKRVADVGTGPNLYPAMILSPFVAPNAEIELLEFATQRSYLAKLLNETHDQKHAIIWRKFEEFMIEVGGEIYEESEKKVKKQAIIQYGNIFDLLENTYDFISSYFVAESIVDSQMPFREAIQSLGKAIKHDGILMIAHVVGSDGWYAGKGTHFPAINLTAEQIKQVYLDVDLDIISTIAVSHDIQSFREGYHGIMLVIAQKQQYNAPLISSSDKPDQMNKKIKKLHKKKKG